MHLPTYIFLRPDTGIYFFRWSIPTALRPAFGGRKDIKRSLNTDNKRLALKLAQRLAMTLERGTFQFMSKSNQPRTFNLIIASLLKEANGTVRAEGIQLDPEHADAELKLLQGLLGSNGQPAGQEEGGATLADMVQAYLDEGDRSAARWTEKTRAELVAAFTLLLEIVGPGKLLSQLSRKDLVHFKTMLLKLPSNRNKDPRFRDKSAMELAGMAIPKSDLMSETTVNKVLVRASSVLKWGVVNGMVGQNYAEGLRLPRSKRADEERDPYTDAEVRLMLDTVAAGQHGSNRFPYMRWIPWIGAYQGMRINEIAQLSLDDFSEVDGIPVINVTDGDDQQIKTSYARRTIPIHPELVEAGLLDYVAELKAKRVQRLFPELSKGRNGYGGVPSKWYGRFRERIGLTKDFHSLRHTVATKLREADVPKDLVSDILGHERAEGETFGRYAKAASVQRKAEALAKLSYKSNVIPLKQPAAAA